MFSKQNQNKRYYFRIQYQKGEITISESIDGKGYLPIHKMIVTILKFVMRVKNEAGKELGGHAALEGLRQIFKLFNSSNTDWRGDGQSVSRKLNIKTAKNTVNRSERIDIEFLGIGGRDDFSNENITKLIKIYKNLIRNKTINRS